MEIIAKIINDRIILCASTVHHDIQNTYKIITPYMYKHIFIIVSLNECIYTILSMGQVGLINFQFWVRQKGSFASLFSHQQVHNLIGHNHCTVATLQHAFAFIISGYLAQKFIFVVPKIIYILGFINLEYNKCFLATKMLFCG